MSEPGRAFSRLLGVAVVLTLAACGGGNKVTDSPAPTPPPTPPPPEVVAQGSISLDPLVLYVRRFSTSKAGSIDVTVDWTFDTNDVDVYIAQGSCTFEQFVALQCNVIASAESYTAKPEKATISTAAAGNYTLLVGNVGPEGESIAFQVVLTPSVSASASTPSTPVTPAKARLGDYLEQK